VPTKRVIVELSFNQYLGSMAAAAQTDQTVGLDTTSVPEISGVDFDEEFSPIAIPGRNLRAQSESVYAPAPFDLTVEPEASTYIVRAEVDENRIDDLRENEQVMGVFSDPVIEPFIVCPGDPAVGSDADVEKLLCTASMRSIGMDGLGVMVAIVDTGVNMAYLNSVGKNPTFDAHRSWAYAPGLTPGSMPIDHGTMVAYDTCIAAPKCTLLDIALLRRATLPTLLSDAVRAYRHLLDIMLELRGPGDSRSLVVNNSWGMFDPAHDFPPGTPGNYSDDPNHPFSRIVGDLEQAGADILFAAGNCGANCPDARCAATANTIYGANGHPSVLCVAGVDTTKARVGYSSIGPGRLTVNKPDLSGYTHFRGSGVYSADGGTSAATPVVAGVVAAIRSKRPYNPSNPITHPAAIRALVTLTAEDLGTAGYDLEHGYGVVNGCELQLRFDPICQRFPELCRPIRPPFPPIPIVDICQRFPWLCRDLPPLPRPIPRPPVPPGPGPDPSPWQSSGVYTSSSDLGQTGMFGGQMPDPVEVAYVVGYRDGLGAYPSKSEHGTTDCGCGSE
jgi:hypothetical protein